MMVERNKFLSKLFFILALLVIAYVSFILLKPYISSILTAIILAYISHPFYNKLNRYLKNRSICAFITCILIVVLLIVPMFFVAKTLVRESTLVYNNWQAMVYYLAGILAMALAKMSKHQAYCKCDMHKMC